MNVFCVCEYDFLLDHIVSHSNVDIVVPRREHFILFHFISFCTFHICW